jgi:hypothetical protein
MPTAAAQPVASFFLARQIGKKFALWVFVFSFSVFTYRGLGDIT